MSQDEQTAQTTDPREMAERALRTAEQFLAAVQREAPDLLTTLREGDVSGARERLGFLLDGLGSLTRLAVDLQSVSDDGGDIDLGQMTRTLRDMVHAQESGDWGEVADRIDQGVLPQLARWREFFLIQLEKMR